MKVDLIQRSPKWLEWRKGKIGSSQSASIMGLNPFCSPYQQWLLMKGLYPQPPITDAMQRGIDLEDEALKEACEETKLNLQPACYEKDDFNFLISSLDGIDEENKVLCEIKVSDRIFEKARLGKIDKMYQCQMQHQFMITGLEQGLFVAYDGFKCKIIEVKRDNEFIDQLLEKEILFYESQSKEEADLSFLDKFSPIEINLNQKECVKNFLELSRKIQDLEDQKKNLRQEIESFSDSENCVFIYDGEPLIKKNYIKREGNVDWNQLCKEKGISASEINLFRKKNIQYCTLKEI